jgi:hypothetical protein
MKGPVRLHIERLVVDGAPGVRADRLTEALVAELRRLAAIAAPPVDTEAELVIDLERSPVAGGRAIAAVIHSHLITEVGRD